MKIKVSVILFALVLAAGAFGQDANFGAAGVSYNPGASPAIAGTGLYARAVGATGTYAFTVLDALPASTKPFTVTTQVSTGVAQRVLTVKGVPIFIPASAGISYTGEHPGWAWTSGALAVVAVPRSKTWKVLPHVRVVKSSVSGTGYQVIGGVLAGWGW